MNKDLLVMTVKELVNKCYDTICIYKPYDDEMLEFIDLYKGDKEHIPYDLLNCEVRCFGAKRKGIIDISIKL